METDKGFQNPPARAMEAAVSTSANGEDLCDLFDSSLRLEEIQLAKGYEEGYSDGLESGKEEGRLVGLKHGFQVGEELGFYRGCVDLWESAIRIDPTAFSDRVRKGVRQIEELLNQYPMMEPENESVQDIMAALRSKFRVMTASMGVKVAYEGYLQEEKGMDF